MKSTYIKDGIWEVGNDKVASLSDMAAGEGEGAARTLGTHNRTINQPQFEAKMTAYRPTDTDTPEI